MRRSIALLILILFAGSTWVRSPRTERQATLSVAFEPIPVSGRPDYAEHLGKFRFEAAWHLASQSRHFGSYSALLAMPDKSFLAISDDGHYLRFTLPGAASHQLKAGPLLEEVSEHKSDKDIESATRDPRTGKIWLALEGANSVYLLNPDLAAVRMKAPAAIAGWGTNAGAEAMTRLTDGRFVLLREAFDGSFETRRHDAVVFEGDPTVGARSWHFVFDGPEGFSPTDMAQLPDGRLLILMRRLVWPMPQRFAGRLAIGDPRRIKPGQPWKVKEVARIASSMPVDNFEGLAVTPSVDGRLAVWIISDDNFGVLQKTILWKLSVDPRELP